MKSGFYFFLILLSCLYGCSSGDAQNKGTETPKTASEEAAPAVSEDELIMRLSVDLVADPQTQAEKDRNDIINYALDNMLDVRATASGLYYRIIKEGEGKKLQWGDRIKAHYRAYFLDGKVFDSSHTRGEPLEFYIGNMISGWNEGLQLLRTGGKALFLIPSRLAYGAEGLKTPGGKELVPPDRVLVFEVEVLERLPGN